MRAIREITSVEVERWTTPALAIIVVVLTFLFHIFRVHAPCPKQQPFTLHQATFLHTFCFAPDIYSGFNDNKKKS